MKFSEVEIFDSYMSGHLRGAALETFEQNLEKNSTFRNSFNAYKTAFESLEDSTKWKGIDTIVDNLRNDLDAEKATYFKAYQNKELSEEEREIFEQDLQEDLLLKYEFNQFEQQNQRKKLLVAQVPKETKVVVMRQRTLYRVISIAAMLVLAVGAFWWISQEISGAHNELYQAYFAKPNTAIVSNDFAVKGSDAILEEVDLLELKRDGLAAFEAKDYKTTISKLDAFVKGSQKSDDTYYMYLYVGVSYMQLDLNEKAIQMLTLSRDNIKDEINNSRRKERVQWYLALAYLKNGNTEKFLSLATPLQEGTNREVREQASKILKEACEKAEDFCKK